MENTVLSKDTLDGFNRLDIAEEKLMSFEDIAIEIRMSCKFIPFPLYLDFFCYIFIRRNHVFTERLSGIQNIYQPFWKRLQFPAPLVNPCWFYRYWSEVHTHRKGSWHWTVFMTLGLRVSLLGNGPYVWLLFIKSSVRINEDSVTTL